MKSDIYPRPHRVQCWALSPGVCPPTTHELACKGSAHSQNFPLTMWFGKSEAFLSVFLPSPWIKKYFFTSLNFKYLPMRKSDSTKHLVLLLTTCILLVLVRIAFGEENHLSQMTSSTVQVNFYKQGPLARGGD